MRRAALLISCLVAFGAAAPGAGAQAPEAPDLAAELTSCVTGLGVADRAATFSASMPTAGGASVLAMKFTLQRWRAGAWRGVPNRTFGRWERSTPGALGFRYAKRVQQLAAPASYRATVRFRWLDAAGGVVRETQRRTQACRERDRRPDLQPVRIVPGAVAADGTTSYAVSVRNTGVIAAPASGVLLSVGGVALTPQPADAIAPGATTTVAFRGPACQAGDELEAAVDDGQVVDEADEGDNALVQRCVAA